METDHSNTFCDWLTVSQEHPDIERDPLNNGERTVTDANGEVISRSAVPVLLKGEYGSSVQISDDGNRVTFSGNPSRWNQPHGHYGLTLDEAKDLVNQILIDNGRPPFSYEKITAKAGKVVGIDHQKHTLVRSAAFSRIDMTTNIITGSRSNRTSLLKLIQTHEFPKKEKSLHGLNTYYGKGSDLRLFRIYDKALQLEQEVIKKTEHPTQIREVIDYCNDAGIVRIEAQYQRFMRKDDMRLWKYATHTKLAKQFAEDLQNMPNTAEKLDIHDAPMYLQKTWALYVAGINVKEALSVNTYYKHRKELLEYGYDIANQNTVLLKPNVKTITIRQETREEGHRFRQPDPTVDSIIAKHSKQA